MKKQTMIISLLAVMASTSANAMNFADYIKELQKDNVEDSKRIGHIALLTSDFVDHFEKAVRVGTTQHYVERTKIEHFDSFFNETLYCEEIDLTACLYDLICVDDISHNLDMTVFPCK